MAHISKKYYLPSKYSVDKFSENLIGNFAAQCKFSGIQIVKQTERLITFKGSPFRYASRGFHYLNGVTCGKIGITDLGDKFLVDRTFCFKEFFLTSLALSLLPVFIFFSPIYEYSLSETFILTNKWIALIFLFAIWGLFFLGNIIIATLQFSRLISITKRSVI